MLWIWSWRTHAKFKEKPVKDFSHDFLNDFPWSTASKSSEILWGGGSTQRVVRNLPPDRQTLVFVCIFKISLFLFCRYIIYKTSYCICWMCAKLNNMVKLITLNHAIGASSWLGQVLKLLNFQCTSEGATNFAQALIFFHELFSFQKYTLHPFLGVEFQRLIHQIPPSHTPRSVVIFVVFITAYPPDSPSKTLKSRLLCRLFCCVQLLLLKPGSPIRNILQKGGLVEFLGKNPIYRDICRSQPTCQFMDCF